MNKNPKRKMLITRGLIIMFLIAPLLSWFLSMIFSVMVSSGFGGISALVVLFPIFFIAGVIILIKGLKEPKQM